MKRLIRGQLRRKRSRHKNTSIETKSRVICAKVLKECRNSRVIMPYVSIGGEVSTHALIRNLLKGGYKVVVPKIKGKKIMPVRISSFNELTNVGRYKIPEPSSSRAFPLEGIDVILVPGLGFDLCGHRVGFGGGYYDRFLSNTNAKKIGLAFEFQIIDKIPAHEHDVPVDTIVTEKRIIRPQKNI